MPDEKPRRLEVEAALMQIRSVQQQQTRQRPVKRWRLDVSFARLALQSLLIFGVGMLVGLGGFVLYRLIVG